MFLARIIDFCVFCLDTSPLPAYNRIVQAMAGSLGLFVESALWLCLLVKSS